MPKVQGLRKLGSFGDVAAEDDPVLDYFLTTDAAKRIRNHEVLLVLGRKGSGKTALVRYFTESTSGAASKPLNLRGYPWNVHVSRVDHGAAPIEAYVSSWRYLISLETALLVAARTTNTKHPKFKAIKEFAQSNYGSLNPDLGDILRPEAIKLSESSFEPEAFGFKLGSISFSRKKGDFKFGIELNALSDLLLDAAIEVASAERSNSLLIHFDELDQGITNFDESRRTMLIGLILAARDVRAKCREASVRVTPVVYIRTDLWDDLAFSDKNKINQTSTLNLEWDADTLLHLVNERIHARAGRESNWNDICSQSLMRGSQTKWNHILARTFLRPRDVIKFLNSALEIAKRRNDEPLVFENEDIGSARDAYSSYLKAELDDEILAHWPQWGEALRSCSAISTVTFTRQQFTEEYGRRKSTANDVTAEEALSLLYRFSVIGYEGRSGYGGSFWVFQYTNPEIGWDNNSARFKVHLGLKEYARLREERS